MASRPIPTRDHSSSYIFTSSDLRPATPYRTPRRMLFADNEASPQFSDYWTDPTRSLQTSPSYRANGHEKLHGAFTPASQHVDTSFTTASNIQKQLLARLNHLGTRLLHGEPSEVLTSDLSARLDQIEALLAAPESQSKPSADIGDSALFIDDSDEEDEVEQDKRVDSVTESEMREFKEQEEQEFDAEMLRKMEETVQRVSRAANELRSRHEEVKHMNDVLVTHLEKTTSKLLTVQTENDELKQDIAFNHSDHILLKLNMKSLELLVAPLIEEVSATNSDFLKGLEDWKQKCNDVDARMHMRRRRHTLSRRQTEEVFTKKDSGVQTEAPAMQDTGVGDDLLDLSNLQISLVKSILDIGASSDDGDDASEGDAQSSASGDEADPTQDPEGGSESSDSEPQQRQKAVKTPWQELWGSLTEFVGMAEQGYDDSDEQSSQQDSE